MKGLRLAAVVLVALAVLAGEQVSRWLESERQPPAARQEAPVASAPAPARGPHEGRDAAPLPGLASVGDARRDRQIAAVVAAMDETGRPPDGVAQGGRRGGTRGQFENAEGRLPRRARGYYVESDVWPRREGSSRGAERLVFGREGEVWYTGDHYDTFTRLR
ncbi:MAG: hypothetical protein NDJ94_06470 [Vicinamibacteria bacterium]|nr:hypothetical protein [Vicinamibacteria bacterium]